MTVELPNGEITLGLSQYDRCYVSPNHRGPFDIEHIIPKIAAKKHPKIFSGILNSYENKSHACKDCHREVDCHETGKIVTYRKHGAIGLIEFISTQYKIPEDPEFKDIFLLQRTVLFSKIRENLRNIQIQRSELSGMHRGVLNVLNIHLYWWENGRFSVSKSFREPSLASRSSNLLQYPNQSSNT